MVDCCESDNMIEIWEKLDKSNPENQFRGKIFCSFISFLIFKNFLKLNYFLNFSLCKQMRNMIR